MGTIKDLQIMICILKEIYKKPTLIKKHTGIKLKTQTHGLCFLFDLINESNKLGLQQMFSIIDFEKFPKFSGSKSFPVASDDGLHPLESYKNCKRKWDKRTKYGKNRWEFFAWVISEMERIYINGGEK